jgi:hypothetical protein
MFLKNPPYKCYKKTFKEDFFMEIMNINKQIFNGSKKIELQEDIIVPDVKPDIVNIIDSSSNSYIYKIEKANGSIRVEGNIDTYISYISSEGDTRVISTTSNFISVLENPKFGENSIFKYNLRLNKSEVKILNERKINFELEIFLDYIINEVQEVKIENEFKDIEGLQLKSENVNVNCCIGIGTSKAQIKENVKIENIDSVADILRFDFDIENQENKVSYNKILSKADCKLEIVYLTEDNRVSKAQVKVPIMSFIELENIKENHKCETTYEIRNEFLKINNNEEHSITCQLDFDVICEAYEEKEIMLIYDMYSLKNDLDFNVNTFAINSSLANSKKKVEIEEKIELEDVKNVVSIVAQGKIVKKEKIRECFKYRRRGRT